MTNKSFRIKNDEPEHATIWPIGTGEYFHVHWEEADEDTTYTKHRVESALERGTWTKLEEPKPKKSFSGTFKFKVKDCPEHDSEVYTYVKSEFDDNIFWDEFHTRYELDEIRTLIENGDWIVVPEESEGLPFVGFEAYRGIVEGLDEALKATYDAVQSNTLLESIKDFTSGTGHDVYIAEGIYKVYRSGEDNPYVCHTDEQLVAVMDALTTLDGVDVG